MKKKIKYFIIILFGIYLEFLRDYYFININLQIEYLENLERNLDVLNYRFKNPLFLESMPIKSIINLKWILSTLFILFYFLIGTAFSYLAFDTKKCQNF